MIANCGQLGLDWQHTSLSAYFEALEAHNAAYESGGAKPKPTGDLTRLKQFMEAHDG